MEEMIEYGAEQTALPLKHYSRRGSRGHEVEQVRRAGRGP